MREWPCGARRRSDAASRYCSPLCDLILYTSVDLWPSMKYTGVYMGGNTHSIPSLSSQRDDGHVCTLGTDAALFSGELRCLRLSWSRVERDLLPAGASSNCSRVAMPCAPRYATNRELHPSGRPWPRRVFRSMT